MQEWVIAWLLQFKGLNQPPHRSLPVPLRLKNFLKKGSINLGLFAQIYFGFFAHCAHIYRYLVASKTWYLQNSFKMYTTYSDEGMPRNKNAMHFIWGGPYLQKSSWKINWTYILLGPLVNLYYVCILVFKRTWQ